jgi:glycosyltransferase involved in cell wall biosynthesis
MISVLQGTAWYPPVHLGGTEIYLTGLVRELRAYGISSRVIAPLGSLEADGYVFDGTTVRTYSVNANPSRAELRGAVPEPNLQRFRQLIAEERPDIYHQHSWARGLGGAHLRVAREAGIKTVLTVHTANQICLRGTMLRFGGEACDGRIDPVRCGACWVHQRGAPVAVARSIAAISPVISAALEYAMPYRRFSTALSARILGEGRKQEFARMVDDADRVVAVCEWLSEALALNGVPAEKLVLSPQGIDRAFLNQENQVASAKCISSDQFRLIYVGRWHPVKGIDVLVKAVKTIPPGIPLTLSIYGVGREDEEQAYATHVWRLAGGDPRIKVEPAVPHEQLSSAMERASALAVPSLCLETGPLVALEAKAVGLPIIGSRLGGIAELVREPEDGLLVPPGDVNAWAAAIITMSSNVTARQRAPAPDTVRTMREVAREMAELYSSLC